MAASAKPYLKLTRNTVGLGRYSSLWLAPDHLMLVTSNGYSEDYARVELRDIKGFFVTETERRGWWTTAWGILAVIWALVIFASVIDKEWPVISLLLLVLTLGAIAWNHALGAGCRTYVVTGVQTAVLPSLVRTRKVNRVLARLQPLIEAAQADLVVTPPAESNLPPIA